MQFLSSSLLELITQTSTNLPADVRAAMAMSAESETPNTQSGQALNIILSNIDMAADDEGPICQDTGMPTFLVHTPVGVNQIKIRKAIREAVAEATRRGKLRPNSVDSLTGKNSGDNLGPETPVVHFHQYEGDEIEIRLILKGGGCENKNVQYSLPAEIEGLGRAGRDIEGVRKCILHAGRRKPVARVGRVGGSHYGGGQPAGRRRDGVRRRKIADRLQGYGGESASGELLRVGGVFLLGVPAARRPARRVHGRDYRLA